MIFSEPDICLQAVVTVNPAAFREMAQNLGFDEVTHTIVVSGEEKTIDKGVLCEIAIQRMPIVCANEQALLIDNKKSNLDASGLGVRGGAGYLYTTDSAFRQDVAGGIDDLHPALGFNTEVRRLTRRCSCREYDSQILTNPYCRKLTNPVFQAFLK